MKKLEKLNSKILSDEKLNNIHLLKISGGRGIYISTNVEYQTFEEVCCIGGYRHTNKKDYTSKNDAAAYAK